MPGDEGDDCRPESVNETIQLQWKRGERQVVQDPVVAERDQSARQMEQSEDGQRPQKSIRQTDPQMDASEDGDQKDDHGTIQSRVWASSENTE